MIGNSDKLEGLTVFVRVVETGSFTAAANTLGRSTSYVSKEVTRLEERLGVRLLHRTTRSISLTHDGRGYFERCRDIVEAAEEAETGITLHQETPKGLLKLSVPVSFGLSHMRRELPRFLTTYPELKLHVEFNDRMVDVVAEGFDLVVRVGELKDSALIARQIMSSRSVVVAAPEFWNRHGRPDHPSQLSGYECIGYGFKQAPDYWEFSDRDGGTVGVAVTLRAVCNSAEMETAMAVAGVGVTRLPIFVCQEELADGRLEVVLEDYEIEPLGVHVVYPHRAHLSAKVRAMVDFLTERFGDSN